MRLVDGGSPCVRTQPSARYDFARILGRSAAMERVIELGRIAARNSLPVVVYGESGTGKEMFAQAIHSASGRRGEPFVAVNCGSIPAELVEAELFGYAPGAFTGARRGGNSGHFEDADGGTLFLDEIGELPLPAQTALLRVLEERQVVRLGGSTTRDLDVRIVAATNAPLEEEVRAKRFRRDLYYRLHVFPIALPPLRARGDEDLALLSEAFVREAEREVRRSGLKLSSAAVARLRAHSWPGNVRELKNVLLRAAAVAPDACIRAEDLILDAGGPVAAAAADPLAAARAVSSARGADAGSQRDALLSVLDACAWNMARTAERIGISRMTLYRRLHRLDISRGSAPHAAASRLPA